MIGQSIGHYKILEKLGAGGMGEVYRAEDTTLDREVAFKVLPSELAESQERLDRFQREAKTLAALDHPNIVHIYTVEEEDGVRFLTMQLVEGKRLSDLIPKGGMPLERIFEIAIPLADALAAAHEKGVIHRDLKPANTMLSDDGRVKVLDFGLAKLRPEVEAPEATALPTEPLTEEGRILGTVPYMSPEQLEGKTIDARSDIFSLGVILYEMTTGERPFKGDSSASLIAAIMTGSPREVDGLRAELPHHLSRIIRHCLEKDPKRRFQSARDTCNELEDLHREETSQVVVPTTPVPGPKASREKRWWPVAVALVLLLVGATATWLLLRPEPGEGEVIVAEPEPPMIVVLPFENLGTPKDEYFADGMTEEITSRLAVVSGLRVISRTSAMQYKENRPSLKQVGEELGVDYVLEGSVRWARTAEGKGRVRITPQLIRVADDSHLWADSYDRVIEDVFEIQSDIATQVIDQLGVTLGESELVTIQRQPTENLDAYQAYLQGLDYVTPTPVWDEARLEVAIRLFQRAAELDPNFVAAHYRLARAHIWWHYAIEASEERATLAKAAVGRAQALAPDSFEAHLAVGFYDYYYSQDFDAARRAFEAAQARRTSDLEAVSAIGYIDRRQGRWEEALQRFRIALEFDPRSEQLLNTVGATLVIMRRYSEARRYFERSIALAPDQEVVYFSLAETHWFGDADLDRSRAALEAMPRVDSLDAHYRWFYQELFERNYLAALDKLASAPRPKVIGCTNLPAFVGEGRIYRLLDNLPRSRAAYEETRSLVETFVVKENREGAFANCYLAEALAALGRREQALLHAKRAIEVYPISEDAMDGPCVARCVAEVLLIAGESEAALDQLEILLPIPGSWTASVTRLRLDPVWDPLRDHPRFQALLEK